MNLPTTTSTARQAPPTAPGRTLATLTARTYSGLESEGRRRGEWSISDRIAPSVAERQALEVRAADLDATEHPATDREIVAWVTRLFSGLGHARADVDEARCKVETYVAVLRGVPLWALREAVLGFLRGSVPGQSREFAPPTAALQAEIARLTLPFREEQAKIRAVLAADVYREPTAEEKARVHERMQRIMADLCGAGRLMGEREPAPAVDTAA
jgi:hypothetical protein